MKNIFLAVLILTAAAYGIFAQNENAVILELSGDVQLKHPGSNDFTEANAGDVVMRNSIVFTGFRSTALIAVGSSVIRVKPLTRLSLAEIQSSSSTETTNVDLHTGRVKVDVSPPSGTNAKVTVQSPTATATSHGTSFEFDMFNIRVNEGKAAFSGFSGHAAIVNAGGSNFLGVNKEPVNPANAIENSSLPFQAKPPSGDIGVDIDY
jgi:hypothetical protein